MGSAKAHTGQSLKTFPPRRVRSITAQKIPVVPATIGPVTSSPSHRAPRATPKKGEVELNVPDKVGPRNRIPAVPRLAESAGRMRPMPIKRKIAELAKYLISKNQGATSQKQIAEVEMPIAVPVLESTVVKPRA